MTDDAATTPPPPSEGVASPSAPTLSLRRAADLAGVSVSTLRRRRAELEAAGATVSPAGWEVPVTALEALGLIGPRAAATTPRSAAPAPAPVQDDQALTEAQERAQAAEAHVAELEADLMRARHRAELAEAIARERLEALNAERLALRMLTTLSPAPPAPASDAGQPTQDRDTAPAAQEPPRDEPQPARRPSWWRRTFG